MLEFQDQKHRHLVNLVDEGAYDTALPLLEGYWAKQPNDYAVFLLLEKCYSGKGDWDAYEKMLLQITPGHEATYLLSRYRIKLALGRKEPNEAIKILNICVDAYKNAQRVDADGSYQDDFIALDENIPEIGSLFKKYGYADAFIERLNTFGHSPEFSGPILLSRYFLYVEQNIEKSLQTIEAALLQHPNDEQLIYALESYRNKFFDENQKQARQHLSNHQTEQAIGLYRNILREKPSSIIAQEYYLSAVVCRFFPPFLWFFSRYNWAGFLPPMGKAFLHAMFFFLCCFYYKDHKENIENDVLENITWVCAVLAMCRFLLFPIVIQFAAFLVLPKYHLFKRPIRFFQGVLILLAWCHVLWAYGKEPEELSFRLILTVAFLINVVILDFAKDLTPIKKWVCLAYTGISLTLGILGCFNIISDIWLGFLIAGWMLPILLNALIDWGKNLQTDLRVQSHVTDDRARRNIQTSKRIFVAAQVVMAIALLVFFAKRLVPQAWESVHLYLSFGVFLTSLVIVMLAENNEPDLVTLSKTRPSFTALIALLLMCMYCCLYILTTCGNHLFREGGICVYSFFGTFGFAALAVFVHWLYKTNWKSAN